MSSKCPFTDMIVSSWQFKKSLNLQVPLHPFLFLVIYFVKKTWVIWLVEFPQIWIFPDCVITMLVSILPGPWSSIYIDSWAQRSAWVHVGSLWQDYQWCLFSYQEAVMSAFPLWEVSRCQWRMSKYCCLIKFCAMKGMLYMVYYGSHWHMWLLNTWNVTEEIKF